MRLGVIRDAEDNTISVFSILENIQAAGFPFFIQKMDILALFERLPDDPPQYEVRFRLSIGETELVAAPMAVNFQDKSRNRSMLHMQGLVISSPGTLRAEAIVNGTTLGTYEMVI